MLEPPHPLAPTPQPIPAQYGQAPPPQAAPSRAPEALQAHGMIVPAVPRQLPSRSEPPKAPARQRADPSGEVSPRVVTSSPRPQRRHRNRILRFVAPVFFFCLALGLIYGVKTFLQLDRNQDAVLTSDDGIPVKKVKPILPDEFENTFEALTESTAETLPAGNAEMPTIGGEPPAPAVDSGIEALRTLEEFLAMKSLEERMPHLESGREEAELARSVLNAPLPEVLKIEVDVRKTNAIENLVDHFYYVDFASESGGVDHQTMLVRIRGDAEPKVVVDPFLDLFGGRFARFAEKPTKDSGRFQVIVSASSVVYEDIPAADKKLPLKVMAREQTPEIAVAYCGKQSKIGRMIRDETSGFSYGQPTPCTVFMRWNLDEDPERPFLEALEITSLDWNPAR